MSDVLERVREVLSRPCADCGITPALVLWQDKETRLCQRCSSTRNGYPFETSPSFHAFMEALDEGAYREVEVVGGPEHGKVYAVRNYVQHITLHKLKPMRLEEYGRQDAVVAFDTINLPIQRTADGRYFVQWQED